MIPSITELRRAVAEAATPLDHPTKVDADGTPLPLRSSVLVFDGGHVGVLVGGEYVIAEGESYDESIWALAHRLGAVDFGPDVRVTAVEPSTFWLRSVGFPPDSE